MYKTIATLLLLAGISASAADQKAKATESQNIPIATQILLDGVGNSESKGVIKSVLMLQCPKDGIKGTGFVLSGGGIITTNSHVVGSCNADELVGISAVSTESVKFAGNIEKDPNRDLALLCATKPLPFGLELKGNENPPVDTEVETWGYPLSYQDPAPVLSRGYVAGYTMGKDSNGQPKHPPVRHLIVNGALNPGNSAVTVSGVRKMQSRAEIRATGRYLMRRYTPTSRSQEVQVKACLLTPDSASRTETQFKIHEQRLTPQGKACARFPARERHFRLRLQSSSLKVTHVTFPPLSSAPRNTNDMGRCYHSGVLVIAPVWQSRVTASRPNLGVRYGDFRHALLSHCL
jgi:Trypsin-like peptidase domain